MPSRPDFEKQVKEQGKIEDTTLIGDNLGNAIYANSQNGVIFIPAYLLEDLVVTSEITGLRDEFGHLRLREGTYLPGQIDSKWTENIREDFLDWLNHYPGNTSIYTTTQIQSYSNMKSIIQQISAQNREIENREAQVIQAEIENPQTGNNRRNFLKKAAFGGVALGGLMHLSTEDTIARTTSGVSRNSSPSDLKITDMRYALTAVMGGTAIIRIDTNQGIYGLGEVRDAADVRYALMLKSRILGRNPCNVEMIFKIIKQFGGQARQAGGVCGVEMALWDIAGKAYGVPAYQLLGGKYRNSIRLYADTPEGKSHEEQTERIKYRIEEQGYTWLKMDLSIRSLRGIPGTLVNQEFWESDENQWHSRNYTGYGNTKHPFTQIQITDKGLEELAKIAEHTREHIGWEIPLSTDHYGHFDLNNCIRLGKAVEKYRLAWFFRYSGIFLFNLFIRS